MKPSDDFSPLVEKGEMEVEGGLFSRLKKRPDPVPIEPGFARVLLDVNGEPLDQQTAGQKYWSRARGWVKVDRRSHALGYDVSLPDPSGLVSFVARISLSARVTDPNGAVVEGAEGVEEHIYPALQKAVRGAHRKTSKVNPSESPVTVLNNLRLAATKNLEKILGDLDETPEWLAVKVTGVTVDLDESTEKHREVLLSKLREVAITDAGKQSQIAQAESEIEVWEIWERGFSGRLADPELRALKRLAADPSRENIDRVAAEFDQIEAEERETVIGMFRLAVEKNHLPEEVMNAIELMEKQIARTRGSLGRGGAQEQVEAPKEEPEVVEAETIEAEPDPEKDSGDTDWNG